ncbi:MAG: GGDEF domain-containing protein [Geminicoccaceae bacterium]
MPYGRRFQQSIMGESVVQFIGHLKRTLLIRFQAITENSNLTFLFFMSFITVLAGSVILVTMGYLISSIIELSEYDRIMMLIIFPLIATMPVLVAGLFIISLLMENSRRLQVEIDRKTQAEHRFSRLANTDELTGLGNRRCFIERARDATALARRFAQPLALLFIDVDGLKTLNDNDGHARGDLALRQLARVLKQGLRQTDYAARYGGDEFVVLMPNTDMRAATLAAERLRGMIEQSSDVLSLTVSVGLASTQGGQVSVEELVARADDALYVAKRSGRNQVCTTFPDGNRQLIPRRGAVDNRARSA